MAFILLVVAVFLLLPILGIADYCFYALLARIYSRVSSRRRIIGEGEEEEEVQVPVRNVQVSIYTELIVD